MKTVCLSFILLLASLALAQNQPSKDGVGLRYAQIAVNVASTVQHQDLTGYFAIFVDDKQWTSLLKDKDIGPFLKLKDQKADRRAVIIASLLDEKAPRVAVYFDGATATDMAGYTPGPEAKISADSLKPVPKDAAKASDAAKGWKISPVEGVASDDGEALPAYQISKMEAGK
jgi:hypothetical protein